MCSSCRKSKQRRHRQTDTHFFIYFYKFIIYRLVQFCPIYMKPSLYVYTYMLSSTTISTCASIYGVFWCSVLRWVKIIETEKEDYSPKALPSIQSTTYKHTNQTRFHKALRKMKNPWNTSVDYSSISPPHEKWVLFYDLIKELCDVI